MRVYDLYGLRIASELELPARPAEEGPADLLVRWGPVQRVADAPVGEVLAEVSLPYASYSLVRGDRGFTFTYPGVCRVFLDASLETVEVSPVSESARALSTVLVAGNVLASALTIMGECVLHASAVDVGNAGVAFVGAPGTGKSTIAALMCAHGSRLVTDDVLRLTRSDDGFRCAPGGTELRLREGAVAVADVLPGKSATGDGRLAVTPVGARGPAPLRVIVFPRPTRTQPLLQATRLEGGDAMMRLTSFPRTLGWRDPDVLERTFRWNAALANEVPAYAVSIPWGPPFDPDIVTRLMELPRSAERQFTVE